MLSDAGGTEQEKGSVPPPSYGEQFRKVFPGYLAIGMTAEQFWDEDSTLVVAYREAEEIRNTKKNQELWLQGMYFYEALCDVAPILRAFAKKGAKPHKYPTEPYALSRKEQRQAEEAKNKLVSEKGLSMMNALVGRMNKKFASQTKEEREVSDNGNNH